MEHFRLRKYRGPEVWARVRVAYEAGETGPSVARRFDVGLSNLRKKSREEGWSRRHQAERLDREVAAVIDRVEAPTPGAGSTAPAEPDHGSDDHARLAPLARAAALLDQGRANEALTLVRASEALARATGEGAPNGAAPTSTAELEAAHARIADMQEELDDLRRQATAQLFTETETFAANLARQMLSERAHPVHWMSLACFHWRARVLGPEVAAADRDHAIDGGWGHETWDEDGRLRPLGPGLVVFADTVEAFVAETASGVTPGE